ncbi:MAG: DUF2283 domain-containing protein [Firmicutes bacterium]|nr:DUF2283 domain-containing protein [Bacillota bacterium]
MEKADVMNIIKAIPYLASLSIDHMWMDYDREADVLYITFNREPADDTEMSDENILFRYKGDKLVGMTVMGASKRINVQ